MAKPIPRSYEQYLSRALKTYMSKIGVDDVNTGSAVTSFFETVAQEIYLASASNFSILRDYNVDRATGEALQRIAEEERVRPEPSRVATGRVTVKDSSFQKISTKIYAGAPSPNAGTTTLKVSDASQFPATGSVYIGRGTNNVEGPLAYSSITPVGGFFEINLTTPTTKFHNIFETVILAQGGNRFVPAGIAVVAPASGGAEDVNFTTTFAVTLLDGENEIKNVPVAAQNPGSQGNVAIGAIRRFISAPFTGATVINESRFFTGRDEESDAELRARVKRARLSKGLGTKIAVKNSVLGKQAPDEAATITSAEIFSSSEETILYIDNGEGYEEKTQGVGIEFIVDNALGGETNFQLATGGQQSSIAKAFLETNASTPFDVRGGDRLAISVGGVVTEHVFRDEDFRSPGFATAYEVVASINGNPEVSFSARTSDNAKKISIFAKTEQREFLQIGTPTQGRDTAELIGLPVNEIETIRLYKNGKLLSKNGRVAVIESLPQQNWAANIASGDNIQISVDGTQAVNYVFQDADFIAEGSFTTVNKSNTLESWANVINAKITGVTAVVAGNTLRLTSNLGANSRAALQVDPSSSLVLKGVFSLANLSSVGAESDFTLSRNTAQFKLTRPLKTGDSLSAGSEATKGSLQSSQIPGGTVNLTADGYFWALIDTSASFVTNSVAADTFLTISKPSANIVRYQTSVPNGLQGATVGDWLIISSEEVSSANRLEGRLHNSGSDFVELFVTDSEFAAAVAEGPILFQDGFTLLRTDRAVQKVKIPAGNYSLFQLIPIIEGQLLEASVSVVDDRILQITTKTEDETGSVLIVVADSAARSLTLPEQVVAQSSSSLFAFYESGNEENSMPVFIHQKILADSPADPPDALLSVIDTVDLAALGADGNELVCGAQPLNAPADSVLDNECVQIALLSTGQVELAPNLALRRARENDRFYLSRAFDFSGNDNLVVVVDSDPVNKTFNIPLFRKATTNPTSAISPTSFRAFDSDSGLSSQFAEFFGPDFAFHNYKVMMNARNVVHPSMTVDEDAILYRSVELGLTGEKTRISYKYPTQPDSEITSVVSVDSLTNISIFLKSGPEVVNSIDGSTEWNVTVTPSGPIDLVSFTWSGTGTNPSISPELSSGGYVVINRSGEFSATNTGVFRVVSATSTSFTVSAPQGTAVSESGVATLTDETIQMYETSDTTAAEIVAYTNANLSDYVTAELVDDNGTAGAGVISLSTYESTNFTTQDAALLDGQNFIYSSDLSAVSPNPQFVFKKPLQLPFFNTATPNAYAFNNGEVVRLVPTTAKQVEEFLNVLAVSGVTTAAIVKAVQKNSKLQIQSEILGSGGSVQVVGGRANAAVAEIRQSASNISDQEFTKLIVGRSALSGFHGSQWVRLQAQNLQKKQLEISNVTTLTTQANAPVAGKTRVMLGNRQSYQPFFGKAKGVYKDLQAGVRVEKHGKLVAIMWNEQFGQPQTTASVNINAATGIVDVNYNETVGVTEYTDLGSRLFSELRPNDSVSFAGFINPENNGTYKVVGVSADGKTVAVDNFEGVDEIGTSIAAGNISATTSIKEGDSVEIGEPFAALNRGLFRVIRASGDTFWIENPNAVEEDLQISANYLPLTTTGVTEFDVVKSGGETRLVWNGNGANPSLSLAKVGDILVLGSDFDVANQGQHTIVSVGADYVGFDLVESVAEFAVQIADVLEIHRSALKFYDYEAVQVGDRFVVAGDLLGQPSAGMYNISEVLSENEVVVDGLIATVSNLPLSARFTEIFVEEASPYYGYKKIFNKLPDPMNINNAIIIVEGTAQASKINRDAGAVTIGATSKLAFPTPIRRGLDAYRYHTGLIRQANKIVYGEPRGTEFEGVAAAGAEIFIQPPLVRRIQLSIVVRLNTGVPFARIVEEVRNVVASLVNSTGIGQSIPLSDVVSSVNSISGVFAVSIDSPSYNPSSDLIVVNPSEKPQILDASADIIVSKVGA